MSKRPPQSRRKGNIVVLAMVLMVGLLAMIALSVDVGFLYITHQQLQRSADAAALAACWELIDQGGPAGQSNQALIQYNVQSSASEFAGLNKVLQQSPALGTSDIEIGYLEKPSDPTCPLIVGSGETPNAVRVRTRRSDDVNGRVPLFFARVLGHQDMELQAEATAVLLTNIGGFRTPPKGKTIGILPFALDEATYFVMRDGTGTDSWAWDEEDETITSGADGVTEVNLYPQGTGSPGNRGTVDIGNNNNSTKDIARQIVSGVSAADLAQHGGTLALNSSGFLYLNGDTGISAGVKDELASIKGKPRVVPIFRDVSGNGNNAMYTIVGWVGIRILDVKLTGSMSSKRVTIQPANVITCGTVPAPGTSTVGSFVYSPPWLVR